MCLLFILGLSANTEYHFKVLAVNPRGYSPYSEEMPVTTKGTTVCFFVLHDSFSF